VIRELGKVFGMSAEEINKLQRTDSYSQIDEMGRLVLQYYKHIQGFSQSLECSFQRHTYFPGTYFSGVFRYHDPSQKDIQPLISACLKLKDIGPAQV